MPLTKMEHFLVLTDDIDGTRDFYCRGLGLTIGARPPLAFPGYWLYVGDTPCIHVAEWRTYTEHSVSQGIPISTPTSGTGPVDHIAFNGLDYEEIAGRLQENDIKFVLNVVPANGLRQMFLSDPNGVKIEINIPPR